MALFSPTLKLWAIIVRHYTSSALRVDVAEAQLKLINDRIAVLKTYLSQAPKE